MSTRNPRLRPAVSAHQLETATGRAVHARPVLHVQAKTKAVPSQVHSTAHFKGGCNPYADENTTLDTANERTQAWGDFEVTGQAQTTGGITTLAGS